MSLQPSRSIVTPHRLAMPRRRHGRPSLVESMDSGRPAPHPSDADVTLSPNAVAAWALAGAAIGVAVIQLYAWATGAPGVALILGSFA